MRRRHSDLCNMSTAPSDCTPSDVIEPDYDAVSTYVPSVVLTAWLTIHATMTCLLVSEEWSSHIVVVSFALNWWFTPRATGHWNLVRYGVGVWLSWIAYGEVLHCYRRDPHAPVKQAPIMMAQALFVIAALAATSANHHSHKLSLAALAFVIGLMAPNDEASFARCSCPIRVGKAAAFSILYSFMYLCRDREKARLEKHFQVVTIASAWVLVTHHTLLVVAIPQCVFVAYKQGYLQSMNGLAGCGENTEKPTFDVEATRPHELSQRIDAALSASSTRATGRASYAHAQAAPQQQETPQLSEVERDLLQQAKRGTNNWRGMSLPETHKSPSAPVDVNRLVMLAEHGNK